MFHCLSLNIRKSKNTWNKIFISLGFFVTECIWLTIGTSSGCCEHGNETSGYVKGGKFLTS